MQPTPFRGELDSVLQVRPASDPGDQSAEVIGWLTWAPSDEPAERIDFAATVGTDGHLVGFELRSDRRDLSAYSSLVGAPAASGFRRRMVEIYQQQPDSFLAHRLLDDLPIASRTAGSVHIMEHPALTARPRSPMRQGVSRASDLPGVNQCEGWREDGTMVAKIVAGRGHLTMGLSAPAVPGVAAWPQLPDLPPLQFRRRRRLLLVGRPDTDAAVHFRDSYSDPDGVERALHSYAVSVGINAEGRVEDIDASGVALPWPECWGAPASATRLRGTSVGQAGAARAELIGLGTCTHLSDTLTTLVDVPRLRGDVGPSRRLLSGSE
jgi:hypothetical protein